MRRFVLPAILILALALRLVGLSRFPVGFTPDEASFGYDAYSILTTGRDQWGNLLPVVLKSFGDYKSALYGYLAVPSVFIFGLSKFAVRLPNVLLGTLAVYLTYLLARELARLANFEEKRAILVGYTAAGLLAISPWHIMMSRGAFEANLTTFFLPLAVYLFLRGLEKPSIFIWSAVAFGLNLLTYHSAKLVSPVVFLGLAIIFRRRLKEIGVRKLLPALTIAVFFFGMMAYSFLGGAGARAADINIFKGSLDIAARERITATKNGMPDVLARAIHNKYQVTARKFVTNYLQYFSPQFLFSSGPAETTYGMIPGRGVLYWFEIPFLVFGLIGLLDKTRRKGLRPLLLWLAVAPIPAALSIGPGYAANRAVVMLPALPILTAFGAVALYERSKDSFSRKAFRFCLLGFSAIGLILFASFLEDYFIQSPTKAGSGMLYGNLEAARWLTNNAAGKNIVVSRKISEPHIYIAFANRYSPKEYQKNSTNWDFQKQGYGWVDMQPNYSLGNYLFRNVDWNIDKLRKNALLVGRPDEFPVGIQPLKKFDYPDGSTSILVVDPATQFFARN